MLFIDMRVSFIYYEWIFLSIRFTGNKWSHLMKWKTVKTTTTTKSWFCSWTNTFEYFSAYCHELCCELRGICEFVVIFNYLPINSCFFFSFYFLWCQRISLFRKPTNLLVSKDSVGEIDAEKQLRRHFTTFFYLYYLTINERIWRPKLLSSRNLCNYTCAQRHNFR